MPKVPSGHQAQALALAWSLALLVPAAHAQQPASPPPEQRQLELLKQRIKEAERQHRNLREEQQALQREAARISGGLVRMAAKMQALEQRLSQAERRIAELESQRGTLISRLHANREAMAHLLAALQRLRRDPPPPFVTSTEDVLKAVRSALMMGAVLPGLDARARKLKADLEKLVRLERQLKEERRQRARALARLRETSGRMQGMLRLKEDLLARTRRRLSHQARRLARLTRQARTLEELLAALERERERQRQARAQREKTLKAQREQKPEREKAMAEGEPEQGAPLGQERKKDTPSAGLRRLALADFAVLKGRLPWPAQGRKLVGFGQKTPLLGKSRGIYLATRPGAVVTTPVNARVEMAGRFRTYGKLVILEVGGGYRIVLAGLARLNVKTGDWVRAGEPLGRMGERPAPAIVIGNRIEQGRPILYMEIRHHDRLRDPARWLIRSRKQAYRQ